MPVPRLPCIRRALKYRQRAQTAWKGVQPDMAQPEHTGSTLSLAYCMAFGEVFRPVLYGPFSAALQTVTFGACWASASREAMRSKVRAMRSRAPAISSWLRGSRLRRPPWPVAVAGTVHGIPGPPGRGHRPDRPGPGPVATGGRYPPGPVVLHCAAGCGATGHLPQVQAGEPQVGEVAVIFRQRLVTDGEPAHPVRHTRIEPFLVHVPGCRQRVMSSAVWRIRRRRRLGPLGGVIRRNIRKAMKMPQVIARPLLATRATSKSMLLPGWTRMM